MSLERKIESSIFLCIPRDLNILGKSCTTFVIVKIVRNLSRGRSPCQRVNHVKSGVIYFSAFIFSYDTIHVSGTIHTWNRGLTNRTRDVDGMVEKGATSMGSSTLMSSKMIGFSCDSPWLNVENLRDELLRPPALPERVETMGDSRRTRGN